MIECVRGLQPAVVIRGNHDKVAAGSKVWRGSTRSHGKRLSGRATRLLPRTAWLAALPQGPIVIDDTVEICHGSPFDEDMYVFDDLDALRSIRATRRPLCLFGTPHSAIFRLSGEASEPNGSRRAAR